MNDNQNLHAAKANKQDEFYTQLEDIEDELKHYKKHFKDKIVLCNCDDPYESNFFKFFVLHFNQLKLKKLICTCYSGSPIIGEQISMFDIDHESDTRTPYKAEVTKVYDITGDGAITMDDIKELFLHGENSLTKLNGDGDFRSEECIEIMKQADIICTNPPFSIYRDYVAQLIEYDKKFIILGNQDAASAKDIFPLLQDNRMWIGYKSGDMAFRVPDYFEPRPTRYWQDETGQKWRSFGNITWYTNLDIKKHHEEHILYKKYDPEKYPKYDNYDAINVDKVADIPCDYSGIMGVPITYLDKHNPDQFEILGLSQKCGFGLESTKKYDEYKEISKEGIPTGSSGKKTNGNPMMVGIPKGKNYYINDEGRCVYSLYSRIFIRNKNPEFSGERLKP